MKNKWIVYSTKQFSDHYSIFEYGKIIEFPKKVLNSSFVVLHGFNTKKAAEDFRTRAIAFAAAHCGSVSNDCWIKKVI